MNLTTSNTVIFDPELDQIQEKFQPMNDSQGVLQIKQIYTQPGFALIITESNQLYKYGNLDNGSLETSVDHFSIPPEKIIGLNKEKVQTISVADNVVHILSQFGSLYAFGVDSYQQGILGLGEISEVSSPMLVSSSVRFKYVANSSTLASAIDKNGKVYQWGLSVNANTPQMMQFQEIINAKSVYPLNDFAIILTVGGNMYFQSLEDNSVKKVQSNSFFEFLVLTDTLFFALSKENELFVITKTLEVMQLGYNEKIMQIININQILFCLTELNNIVYFKISKLNRPLTENMTFYEELHYNKENTQQIMFQSLPNSTLLCFKQIKLVIEDQSCQQSIETAYPNHSVNKIQRQKELLNNIFSQRTEKYSETKPSRKQNPFCTSVIEKSFVEAQFQPKQKQNNQLAGVLCNKSQNIIKIEVESKVEFPQSKKSIIQTPKKDHEKRKLPKKENSFQKKWKELTENENAFTKVEQFPTEFELFQSTETQKELANLEQKKKQQETQKRYPKSFLKSSQSAFNIQIDEVRHEEKGGQKISKQGILQQKMNLLSLLDKKDELENQFFGRFEQEKAKPIQEKYKEIMEILETQTKNDPKPNQQPEEKMMHYKHQILGIFDSEKPRNACDSNSTKNNAFDWFAFPQKERSQPLKEIQFDFFLSKEAQCIKPATQKSNHPNQNDEFFTKKEQIGNKKDHFFNKRDDQSNKNDDLFHPQNFIDFKTFYDHSLSSSIILQENTQKATNATLINVQEITDPFSIQTNQEPLRPYHREPSVRGNQKNQIKSHLEILSIPKPQSATKSYQNQQQASKSHNKTQDTNLKSTTSHLNLPSSGSFIQLNSQTQSKHRSGSSKKLNLEKLINENEDVKEIIYSSKMQNIELNELQQTSIKQQEDHLIKEKEGLLSVRQTEGNSGKENESLFEAFANQNKDLLQKGTEDQFIVHNQESSEQKQELLTKENFDLLINSNFDNSTKKNQQNAQKYQSNTQMNQDYPQFSSKNIKISQENMNFIQEDLKFDQKDLKTNQKDSEFDQENAKIILSAPKSKQNLESSLKINQDVNNMKLDEKQFKQEVQKETKNNDCQQLINQLTNNILAKTLRSYKYQENKENANKRLEL